MSLSFNTDDVIQGVNSLQGKIQVYRENQFRSGTAYSTEYVLMNDSVVIQFMCIEIEASNTPDQVHNLLFVRFTQLQNIDQEYEATLSSKELNIFNKIICDDGTWRMIFSEMKQLLEFNLQVVVKEVVGRNSSKGSFSALYEDTDLTDFELKGVDGSVLVHRTVLYASSPVLRSMLCGPWKEAAEACVEIDSSRLTLQHLKDYVYLGTLPETGLQELLLLASCYMMPDLEKLCVEKLVRSLTATRAKDLLEFAVSNKLTELMLQLLDCVQNKVVMVADIRANVKS